MSTRIRLMNKRDMPVYVRYLEARVEKLQAEIRQLQYRLQLSERTIELSAQLQEILELCKKEGNHANHQGN